MSTISLWMQRGTSDWCARALALFISLGSVACAETGEVRLGRHFLYSTDHPYSNLLNVSEVWDELRFNMLRFVAGFKDCPDIVAGDLSDGIPRDKLRDTWTAIQSLRVECWAVLQFDASMPVAPTSAEDRLTPTMIHGIMAKAEQLSRESADWSKTLLRFADGTIMCKDKERCHLSAPEDGEWANYSLYLDLILVSGDNWFIQVVQAYQGREGFVYGVHWRSTEGGGEVISIFPDLQ